MKNSNYYFNEETLEYFHSRSYEIQDAEELRDEMFNFVNVDYEVGDNESVDEAVKALIEVVTSHRNM
tara:strand:- start:120 stop:320 length:201 start_codon:yes stop_codon:yes gene_type:complete